MSTPLPLLPLGKSGFPNLRANSFVYVDKTDLICRLAKTQPKVFLTRPRRFGKSLLVSTFESLFKHGLRDFRGLNIEKSWNDKTYDVVRLDFSRVKNFSSVEQFRVKFFDSLASCFNNVGFEIPQDRSRTIVLLTSFLEKLASNSLVVLIDEYDAPLSACIDNKPLFESVRAELSDFYLALKSCDECLRFLFITGITKFSSTSIFSEFNNLKDISLDSEYGTLLGYTENEIKTYFSAHLAQAQATLRLSTAELLDGLKSNYNGFCFDRHAETKVFCPWSVLNFLNSPSQGFANYWYASGGHPTVLLQYFKGHELRDPSGYAEPKKVWLRDLETPRDFENVDCDVLLTQAGYLTIRSVTPNKVVELAYPNQEVAMSMAQLYADQLLAGKTYSSTDNTALEDILANGNLEDVVRRFNEVFNAVDYKNYPITSEASCRATLQVLMIGADMVPHVESHSALGRSDIEVDAGSRYWVFEFKFAETQAQVTHLLAQAVDQMQVKRYGGIPRETKLLRAALVFCAQERRFVAWQEVKSN
mgnify:FL=1